MIIRLHCPEMRSSTKHREQEKEREREGVRGREGGQKDMNKADGREQGVNKPGRPLQDCLEDVCSHFSGH